MNTIAYNSLISNERAKIEVLRAKIDECERRISMLQSLQTDDDLDAALTRRVLPPTSVAENLLHKGESLYEETRNTTGAEFPRKALSKNTLAILRFAGNTEKSIDEFLGHAAHLGITNNRQRIRALLHQYKTTYKLLESGHDGYFKLSALGIEYLSSIDRSNGGNTSSAK